MKEFPRVTTREQYEFAHRVVTTMTDILAPEYIASAKRQMRRYLRGGGTPRDRRIVKDDGIDGYTELIRLPEEIQTMEEATRYFNSVEFIPPALGPYDCTWQAFTAWDHIFQRNGQWYAYHRVIYDN